MGRLILVKRRPIEDSGSTARASRPTHAGTRYTSVHSVVQFTKEPTCLQQTDALRSSSNVKNTQQISSSHTRIMCGCVDIISLTCLFVNTIPLSFLPPVANGTRKLGFVLQNTTATAKMTSHCPMLHHI